MQRSVAHSQTRVFSSSGVGFRSFSSVPWKLGQEDFKTTFTHLQQDLISSKKGKFVRLPQLYDDRGLAKGLRGLCVFSPHGGTTCVMGGDEQSKWELFRTSTSRRDLPFGTERCWKILGTAHAGLRRTREQLDCALHCKLFVSKCSL